jgi:hypothetical protein
MNGFYLGALVVAFVLLITLSNVGKSILYHWSTPVSEVAPSTISSPLVPTPAGGVTLPASHVVTAPANVALKPVLAPGSGQPIGVMPVPANPPAPPPNAAPRADELPPAPRSY